MNISNEVSGSVRIKKDGLYLSISPITATHQGQYVCLVNNTNMDILRTYNITVTGGKHAVVCIFFIFIHLKILRNQHCACGMTSNTLLVFFCSVLCL